MLLREDAHTVSYSPCLGQRQVLLLALLQADDSQQISSELADKLSTEDMMSMLRVYRVLTAPATGMVLAL